MDDEKFMRAALALAQAAADEGEVPVGCVVVRGEEIVGRGGNRRESAKSALARSICRALRARFFSRICARSAFLSIRPPPD